MFCPSCGNEIPVELKYCNRCGASLAIVSETYPMAAAKPIKVAVPMIVLGLTVTIGLGIIFGTASELTMRQLHPVAIAWMSIFGLATLFGCTALMLRFWLKVLSMNRESAQVRPPVQMPAQMTGTRPTYQPRLEPMPSVTEHTTRTFSQVYREGYDPAAR